MGWWRPCSHGMGWAHLCGARPPGRGCRVAHGRAQRAQVARLAPRQQRPQRLHAHAGQQRVSLRRYTDRLDHTYAHTHAYQPGGLGRHATCACVPLHCIGAVRHPRRHVKPGPGGGGGVLRSPRTWKKRAGRLAAPARRCPTAGCTAQVTAQACPQRPGAPRCPRCPSSTAAPLRPAQR